MSRHSKFSLKSQGRRVLLAVLSFSLLWGNTASQAQAVDFLALPALSIAHPERTLQIALAHAGTRIVSVGERGIILYSDDQGQYWQQAEVPVSVMLTAVSFPTPDVGWAVGHGGVVLKTQDQGAHWQKVVDGRDLNQLAVDEWQHLADEAAKGNIPDHLDEAAIADGLGNAQSNAKAGPSLPLLSLCFISPEEGWIVGAYGQIFHTRDGGEHWQSVASHLENPNGYHLNSMVALADGSLLIAGEAGLLLRSTDRGEHFTEEDSPYEGSYFGLSADQKSLYLLGLRGHVFYQSLNDQAGFGGWQSLEFSPAQTIAAGDMRDGNVVLAGNAGLVLYGRAGQPLTAETLPGRHPYSAVLATSNGWILAGEGGITRLDRNASLIATGQQDEGVSP